MLPENGYRDGLVNFFSKYEAEEFVDEIFSSEKEGREETLRPRRIANRLKWYLNEGESFPLRIVSLRIVFISAMAEGIDKIFHGRDDEEGRSRESVENFFRNIPEKILDELVIVHEESGIDRNLTNEEFAQMLYYVRCDAMHGREFWGFSLQEDGANQGDYNLFQGVFVGSGKAKRKIHVSLKTSFTYEALRDIVMKIGIKYIKDSIEQNK